MIAFALEHALATYAVLYAAAATCTAVVAIATIHDLRADIARLERDLAAAHNLLFATAEELTDFGGKPFLRAAEQRDLQRAVDDAAMLYDLHGGPA